MPLTDTQLARLPAPVRHEIERLQADLADAQKRLARGSADNDTFADPYNDVPRPLGAGAQIRFGGTGHEGTFDAKWDGGCLIIKGNEPGFQNTMVIMPQSGNTIRIGFGPRQ